MTEARTTADSEAKAPAKPRIIRPDDYTDETGKLHPGKADPTRDFTELATARAQAKALGGDVVHVGVAFHVEGGEA